MGGSRASAGRIAIGTRQTPFWFAAGIVLVVMLIALPVLGNRSLLQDLFLLFTLIALAQFWNLLAGYAGLVSVGQQAYVGLGGYALFAAVIYAGLNPIFAIPLAGILCGLVAVPTALVIFRLSGAYFAIGTWVVAEVFRLILAQMKALGGGTGTALPVDAVRSIAGIDIVAELLDVRAAAARDILAYWLALLLAVLSIAAIYAALRSRRGLGLSAMRDSERGAASVGVNLFTTKLGVYVGTAFGTGMVGALIYMQRARIAPDAAFSVLDWTAYVIVIVVIGGIGTIEGPLIGALIFYLLQDYLAVYGAWYLILLGVIAIGVMLVAPQGIWGSLAQRYGLSVFPVQRRLVQD
jgi:branched-chain amino acid transport system permease protein